jgi:hypothetical protein
MLSTAVLAVAFLLQCVCAYDDLVVRLPNSPAQGSMYEILFEPASASPLNIMFVWYAVTNSVTLNSTAIRWPQTQSEWVLAGKMMNLPCSSNPHSSLC